MVENHIDARCMELGVTQRWLSEESGVPESTVSEIKHGRHIPNIEVAAYLARALHCEHIEDIFTIT